MSEHLYLLTICLFLGTVLLVFGMRSFASIQQARSKLAAEAGYRQVAEQAAAAEAQAAAALADIQACLAEVRGRLADIEKILRSVE